ncbi:MAG: M48 family metalloprotease [Spirochaetales bacterium]|nr:M48 family metalloprotease [Spirochaetales bacterium]
MKRKAHARALLGVAAALLAAAVISCATNPVTQETEFMLLSTRDEIALGRQTDPQILQSYGHYEDPELDAYITDLGRRMGALTHRPELDYSFKVLDSPVINAFAVPGGYVYLTRGILAYLNDEAELAGVVGHELGHIAARHSAQQYSRAQLAQLGLGLGAMLSETVRKYAGLAQAGISLLFLSFSRENERQADDLGVLYSSRAGYDATRMANLFLTLERLNPSAGSDGLPAWFSTHPNPPDRIAAVRQAAARWQADNPQVQVAANREQYLRRLEGLVFDEDPRQGYVEAEVFYHPTLRFQFPLPAGWTVNNTPSQVQVFTEAQDAAILLFGASESTPAAAAEAFVGGNQATVLASEAVLINGYAARRLVCDLNTEQGVARVLSCFIQKDDAVYVFLGYTGQDRFDDYLPYFERTIGGFRNLSDPARIDVRPARLTLRRAPGQGTLRQALQGFGVPSASLEAHAIMNGLELDEPLPAGTLIKIVVK